MKLDSYEHLIGIAQGAPTARLKQDDFNRLRLERVVRANQMRPQFLPITHDLPGVASSTTYEESTDELLHDAIIWGAMTDGLDRKAMFLKNRDALPLIRTGREPGANLTLEAIAGKSAATEAQPEPIVFPNPYDLKAGEVLTLGLFQETEVAAKINTVLLGTRALRANADDAMLSANTLETVRREIAARPAPETKYSMAKVTFADGTAYAETPKTEEPLLVLGFRATFRDAMINFGFDTDSQFAKRAFPIWALASDKKAYAGMFLMLREQLFIAPQGQLRFTLKNTIDNVRFAVNGQIELLLSTV